MSAENKLQMCFAIAAGCALVLSGILAIASVYKNNSADKSLQPNTALNNSGTEEPYTEKQR